MGWTLAPPLFCPGLQTSVHRLFTHGRGTRQFLVLGNPSSKRVFHPHLKARKQQVLRHNACMQDGSGPDTSCAGTCIIGIDPDTNGALAWIAVDTNGDLDMSRKNCAVIDVPKYNFFAGGKNRRSRWQIDPVGVASIISDLRNRGFSSIKAFIERPSPLPINGSFSNFVSGIGFGIWCGALCANHIKPEEVFAGRWKRDLDLLKQPKDESRELARLLFPSSNKDLRRKRDHGRAEALLIAWWGARQSFGFQSTDTEILKTVGSVENSDGYSCGTPLPNEDGSGEVSSLVDYSVNLEHQDIETPMSLSGIDALGVRNSNDKKDSMFLIQDKIFESSQAVLDAELASSKEQVKYRVKSTISKWKEWNYLVR